MGSPKQPTRQNVINWVSTTWEGIKDVVRDAFVIFGLTSNPDGSDNEKVFSHIPGDLANQKADDNMESDEEDGNDTVDDFDSFDDWPICTFL